MDLNRLKAFMQGMTAFVAAWWAQVPELTQVLVYMMAIDLLLGIVCALNDRSLSPSVAWHGVTKKLASLLIVGVTAILNPYIPRVAGLEVNLHQAATAFYLVPEILSIARNAANLGAPMFPQLEQIASYFQGMSAKKRGGNADKSLS